MALTFTAFFVRLTLAKIKKFIGDAVLMNNKRIFLFVIAAFVVNLFTLEASKPTSQELADKLWQSMEQRNFAGIRDAISRGAEVVTYYSFDKEITALEYALEQQDIYLMRFILQEAAKRSPGYALVNSVLFAKALAQWKESQSEATKQNKKMVLLLVLHGAQLNPHKSDHREVRSLYQEKYADEQKLLYTAAREGLVSLAHIALKNGASLEKTTQETNKYVYAHAEASVSDKEQAENLIKQESSITTHFTALELAVRYKHERMVRFLLTQVTKKHNKETACALAQHYCYHDIRALLD